MLQLFLFLHVMGAIAVFGPTFIFPIISRASRAQPQNGNFAARLIETVQYRIVIPGAIVQGLTGLALIGVIGLDPTTPEWRWLMIAVALYVVAVTYSITIQGPAVRRMVALTGAMAGPRPEGAPSAPAGPPPELLATSAKLQRGGMFLSLLILTIVLLMVTKPTFG